MKKNHEIFIQRLCCNMILGLGRRNTEPLSKTLNPIDPKAQILSPKP